MQNYLKVGAFILEWRNNKLNPDLSTNKPHSDLLSSIVVITVRTKSLSLWLSF